MLVCVRILRHRGGCGYGGCGKCEDEAECKCDDEAGEYECDNEAEYKFEDEAGECKCEDELWEYNNGNVGGISVV